MLADIRPGMRERTAPGGSALPNVTVVVWRLLGGCAQLEASNADSHIDTGLLLDAERLQHEAIAGPTDQNIGAGAQAKRGFSTDPDILARERAGA